MPSNTKEYSKSYYDKTKIKQIETYCVKTVCPECHCEVQKWNLAKHKKAKNICYVLRNQKHLLTNYLQHVFYSK